MQEQNRSMQLRQALQQQMGVKNPTVKTGLNTMGILSAGRNKTTDSRFGLQKPKAAAGKK